MCCKSILNDILPAGFTVVDCLALGTFGHVIGCGIILGLKNTGAL